MLDTLYIDVLVIYVGLVVMLDGLGFEEFEEIGEWIWNFPLAYHLPIEPVYPLIQLILLQILQQYQLT
jgi:hypothetical protein